MAVTDEPGPTLDLIKVLDQLRTDLDESLVWRNDHNGRAYRGSGNPNTRATPPDITADVDALEHAGWIEKRLPTSAVYRISEAGHEALTRAGR
jgi:hypothetical protein